MKRWIFVLLAAGCTLHGERDQCETQADCLDGFVCAAGTCERPSCTPMTCDGRCGTIADACTGSLECGACPSHCMNHVQDPSETDIDCGGDCSPCALGSHCAVTADCQTGTCDGGTCRAGKWSSAMAMPTARSELAAVAGNDGRIYVIGGNSSNGKTGAMEAYEPASDSWTTCAPMPTPRYGLTAVVGSDGKIYAIGGDWISISNAGPSIVVQVYDPSADSWQTQTSLPTGRSDASAAVDATGTIYIIGGFDGVAFQTLGSVATRTTSSATWSALSGPMTTARSLHASAVLPDGKIYVVGGTPGVGDAELDAFEVRQPGTSGWHTLPAMPTPRKLLAAAGLGSRLYAIGGNRYNGAGISYTSVVEAFDPGTQTWSQVTSLPTGRWGHAAVTLGGKIYVIGGHRQDTDAMTATLDVYTPDP